jgi:hypothetical protein
MKLYTTKDYSSTELLRLAEQDKKFECPICGSELVAIPQDWQPGQRLAGLACPRDQKHFLIYSEKPEGLGAFREWVKDSAKNRQ